MTPRTIAMVTALLAGDHPQDVAARFGVARSTVSAAAQAWQRATGQRLPRAENRHSAAYLAKPPAAPGDGHTTSPKDYTALIEHYRSAASLQATAAAFGLSRERVRQLGVQRR